MFDVFLGFAFLASATVANKYALSVLSLSLMVGLRMLGAGIILLIYNRQKNNRLSFAYIKQDLFALVGIALLTMLLPSLFKAYALKYMFASKASFFGSLDPFVTAVYAYFLFSERLSKKKILGIIIGFTGTLVLILSRPPASEQELMAWWVFSYPEIAALLAMAIGRLGWLFVQQLIRKERYTAPEVNGLLMTISGILAFIMPFISAGIITLLSFVPLINHYLPSYTFLDAASLLHLNITPETNLSIIVYAVIYTIVVGNVIGYTMYAGFLRHHSATFISLAGFSVPLYISLFSALLLNEPLTLSFLIASCITFTGLLIFYQDDINKISQGNWHPITMIKKIFTRSNPNN